MSFKFYAQISNFMLCYATLINHKNKSFNFGHHDVNNTKFTPPCAQKI